MAGTLVIDTLKSSTTGAPVFQNTNGVETGQLCRAWVNFNGTIISGESRRASFNVSSVTRNTTGDYTINFTTAMPDVNYAVSMTASSAGITGNTSFGNGTFGTSTLRFQCVNAASTAQDREVVALAIFR